MILAPKEIVAQRLDTCKHCEHFIALTQLCGQCYCFMPAKARLAGSECPIKKWLAVDKPTLSTSLVKADPMQFKWRVLSIDKEGGHITVRYTLPELSEEDLMVPNSGRDEDGKPLRCITDRNITIRDFDASVEDIHRQIEMSAPLQDMNRIIAKRAGKRVEALDHLSVGEEHEAAPPPPTPPPVIQTTPQEIEKMLRDLAND